MCVNSGCLVSVALFIGLVQSLVWIAVSVTSGLVYLCVVTVAPYKDGSDFFRVTAVKLYFEGPECVPDGSYLGKFNEDYRNPEVLRLFSPDKVFAVMVAYFILNVVYYFLSVKCWLNRKPKSAAEGVRLRKLLTEWSLLTLVICAVDVVLSAKFVLDVISLNDYMGDKRENSHVYTSSATNNVAEVPYIPLLLALLSSRFIGIWLWNFLIGLLFFFNALCGKTHVKHPPKTEKQPTTRVTPPEDTHQPTRDTSTSTTLSNGPYGSSFDVRSHPDSVDLKRSMEATTRFSSSSPKTLYPRDNNRNWSYVPSQSLWSSSASKSRLGRDEWQMTNEAYVHDEQVPEEPSRQQDFEHDLKNFEQGQRKIKIVKPPLGKPVSVPVPPPLPTSGSCNC